MTEPLSRATFDEHVKSMDQRFCALSEQMACNTEAVTRLAESVDRHAKNSAGVIELYNDFQGTIRMGTRLQAFIKWLLGFGVVGAGVAWLVENVLPKAGQ